MYDSIALLIGIVAVAMIGKNYTLAKYDRKQAIPRFVIFILAFVLLLWVLVPDPRSPHVRPAVKYIGLPVALFGVPVISFLSYVLRNEKRTSFSIQDVAEILFVPIWFVFCYAVIFELNWIWI